MSNYVKFLQIAEDFKNKFKDCSCCSDENFLAQSWKKAFLIVLLGSHVDEQIDMEKSLKLAIVQNLAECIDSQNIDCEPEKAKRKALKAYVKETLDDDSIYQLYKELHKNETLEAQFVNSLDENFEEAELSWMKGEDEESEEDDDSEEYEESEEEGDDEEEIEEEAEEKAAGKEDMSLVFEYLNKIADVLKIDFKEKKHKDKDEDKDYKKCKDHKKDKKKDKKDKKDKKHKDKYRD